ncbi:MAG: hypothetical protein ACTSQ0_01755 [Candidatus Heimdallarchaeota archaeon]
MRKTTLISSLLILVVIFSASLKIENTNIRAESDDQSEPISCDALGDPIGDKGILAQYTNTEFILDGNLSDWETEGIESEVLAYTTVYLAYDSNYVYVGLTWDDISFNDSVFTWNKTGMYDDDDADWFPLDGADDMVSVGFAPSDNITKGDFWIWTASNRTLDGYVHECDYEGSPDMGLTPYLVNTNDTDFGYLGSKPVYYSNWTPIVDYAAIPIGTLIDGWYNKGLITPTASQVDVTMNWTYSNEQYTMEFKRPLDTSKSDDYALDFGSDDLTFYLNVKNQDDTIYESYYYRDFKITIANDPAELSFDALPESVSETLLITGEVYDDFEDVEIMITCSGWDNTFGPGVYFEASINTITGAWSFLFFYDEWDMPLGTNNITVSLDPKYEDPIILWQEIEIEDTRPPYIYGITDVSDWYPDGVPLNIDEITITIGIEDDYCQNDDLTAYLYYYKGDDVLSMEEMIQFSATGRTFSGVIPVEHDEDIEYLYNYFVEVFDATMNKVTTTKLNFTSITGIYTPILTGSENSQIVPLPILGITIAAMVLLSVIGKANQKKRK